MVVACALSRAVSSGRHQNLRPRERVVITFFAIFFGSIHKALI